MTKSVVALTFSLTAAMAFAQSERREPAVHGLIAIVREPTLAAAVGARGTLRCPPASTLVALQDLPASRFAAIGELTTVTGTSDASGKLRFETDAPRAGFGIVASEGGLGALIPRLRPGMVPRLVMQPMAEVTAKGDKPFVLWARHKTAVGESVALPFDAAERKLLPPGDYEIWARRGDEWLWQRIVLASSQRLELDFVGPRRSIASRDAAWIHAAHWPEVCLVEPKGEAVLLGNTPVPLSAGVPAEGFVLSDGTLPLSMPAATTAWPPASTAAPIEFVLAAEDEVATSAVAELFVLQRTGSGSWRVVGASRADDGRRFRVAAPPEGDTWVLLVVAGRAPVAVPFAMARARAELAPVRGDLLVVRATDERGDPAIDLVVDWVPRDGDAATVRAHTDAQGRAPIGRVTAPGKLLVSDDRYTNREIAVDAIPGGGLVVRVESGASIVGRIVLDDGSPVAGAVVSLRDSTGQLRPASRAAVTGSDGTFTFTGLPAEHEFVVFATIDKDRRTWSGRRTAITAGGDSFDIVIRNEDPDLRTR